MKTEIIISSGKEVILNMPDFIGEFEVDDILKTDYANLYGEAVTIDVVVNHIGYIRSELEEIYTRLNLEAEILEATLKKRWRREANGGVGKFTIKEDGAEYQIKSTEDSLKDCARSDKGVITIKNNAISAKSKYEKINSFYWSAQKKANKLENWTHQVTPQEFLKEVIEDTINGITVKKRKSIVERKHKVRKI